MQKQSQEIHWPSVLQFGGSVLAIAGLWSLSLLSTLSGLYLRFIEPNADTPNLPLFLMSAGLAAVGIFLVPSAYYSLRRMMGRPIQPSVTGIPRLFSLVIILPYPLVLLAGYYTSQSETVNWLLLPPLHVLAIGIPVIWLASLALQGLSGGSLQRRWGVFGAGLVLGPGLAFFAEMLLLIAGLIALIFWFIANPAAAEEFASLGQRLLRSPTSESLTRILGPAILQPSAIFIALAFWAGLVPLAEEAIKPIGLWLLAGRRFSPAEGFTAGVLCGAGFAIMESMLLASQSESWYLLVFARLGTGAIHILTTGVTGWAMAGAWREGRYLQLGAAYLGAVLLHATWNTTSVLMALEPLTKVQTVPEDKWIRMLSVIGSAAPYILGSLAILSVFTLVWINLKLRRQEAAYSTRSTQFDGTNQLPD